MKDHIFELSKLQIRRLKHLKVSNQTKRVIIIIGLLLFVLVSGVYFWLSEGPDKKRQVEPGWMKLDDVINANLEDKDGIVDSASIETHINPNFQEYTPIRQTEKPLFLVDTLQDNDEFEELPPLVVYQISGDDAESRLDSEAKPTKLDLPKGARVHGHLVISIYNRDPEHVVYGRVTETLEIDGIGIVPIGSQIFGDVSQFIDRRVYFESDWRIITPDGEEYIVIGKLQEVVKEPKTGHLRFGDGRAGLTMRPVGEQSLPEPELGEFGEKFGDTVMDFADGFAQRAVPLNLPAPIQSREALEALQDVGANKGNSSASNSGNYFVPAATKFYLWAY